MRVFPSIIVTILMAAGLADGVMPVTVLVDKMISMNQLGTGGTIKSSLLTSKTDQPKIAAKAPGYNILVEDARRRAGLAAL